MVALAFNAQQYEPKYAVGGLAPGRYKVIISDTVGKSTKDGEGGYLALTLKVLEGPANGQTTEDRLNLWNKSAQAVQIANNQLSAYCHVTGKFMVQDSQELCNIPFQVEIRQQRNNPEFTEVGNIFDINGAEPGKGQPQTQAAPAQAAPPNPGAAPWGASRDPNPGGWPGNAAPAQAEPAQAGQTGWTPPAGGAPAGNAPPWANR